MDSPLSRHRFSRALCAVLALPWVLASCGPDQTGYVSPVCDGSFFALSGLSPPVPVDFVQLRQVRTNLDGDSSTEVVLNSSGTACATASDKAACESALSTLSSRSGFRSRCNEQVCYARYLVTTRGDEVVAHTSLEALKGFLGPIDTAQEAVLVASASYEDLSCRDMPRGAVRPNEGGGFTVIGHLKGFCLEVTQFVLDVSVSGEVKELRRYVLEPAWGQCQASAGASEG
ncbi:hypothetical protein ATI61_103675 [Archangium gephyra]|uniref:Lipoprotein n=1 Tax=Archangium gephyra TaxID=48 RepID=A0AAC8Q7E8_9BACT|nr:hypothetical protein [Archangium gephyra]AKJ01956.1 putative lipoprotein [Archangium gephyra]REG34764.1 hypothetical protein ATI61_103675 [Archangium gephyra]